MMTATRPQLKTKQVEPSAEPSTSTAQPNPPADQSSARDIEMLQEQIAKVRVVVYDTVEFHILFYLPYIYLFS